MGIEIRLPHITGTTEREQLEQLKKYLYQLREQLQWAFDNIGEGGGSGYVPSAVPISSPVASASYSAEATFNSIKALIIKSADIVDAYYEEINKRLEGAYVAQSDFGVYAEQTAQEIEANSKSTTQRFENVQVLIMGLDGEVKTLDGDLETIGQDLSYHEKSILDLSQNLEAVDSNVMRVEVEVSELDNTLQSTKTEIQGTISNVDTELKQIVNNTKTELSGSINTTKEELAGNINSTKEELAGSIDNAKSQLTSDLNSAKEELSGSIDNAKSELSGDIDNAKEELEGMVDIVDEDLQNTKTDVNGRIDDTNGSVAGLGESLNDVGSRIAEVDEDLQDSKEAINESIQGVQERVTGVNALLEDAKAQLRGSIDDLDVFVTGLREVIIGVTAYLKSGLLYYTDAGIPVYGLEIGQSVRDEIAGTEVFNKYARFTSEKLSFYDSNGIEVAYISDKKLFIKMAEITVSFKIGGLISLVMENGDVVKKWVGG